MVLKKKEQRARLEMGNKTDKIPAASEEVQEWETKLEESRANFLKVSEVVKAEIDFFERYRVKDFKTSIIQYMEELMDCQLKMVQYWEEFIPEVKNTLYWTVYLLFDNVIKKIISSIPWIKQHQSQLFVYQKVNKQLIKSYRM